MKNLESDHNKLQEEQSMVDQLRKHSKEDKFFTGFIASFLYLITLIFLITGAMWGYDAFVNIFIVIIFSPECLLPVFGINLFGGFLFKDFSDEDYANINKKLWKNYLKFCVFTFVVMSSSEFLHHIGWLNSRMQFGSH